MSGGRKDLKLKTRVSHIWLIPDKENADEIVCMNMLLVDEKVYLFILQCIIIFLAIFYLKHTLIFFPLRIYRLAGFTRP